MLFSWCDESLTEEFSSQLRNVSTLSRVCPPSRCVDLLLWPMSTILPVSFLYPVCFSQPVLTLTFSVSLSFQSHKANSHAVRFRVCQLINKLLGSMAENAQIDDDLFDRIHQAMLVRVTDKFPNVRIQAALAMTRLQQPKDPDCPTINGLFIIFLDYFHSGENLRLSINVFELSLPCQLVMFIHYSPR